MPSENTGLHFLFMSVFNPMIKETGITCTTTYNNFRSISKSIKSSELSTTTP